MKLPDATTPPSAEPGRPRTRWLLVPAAAVVALLTAAPAWGHITVSSPDAAPGGFGKVVFRVPTESDTASTTELTVRLPSKTPFAFVSTKPVPGWTVSTTERTLDEPVKAEGFTLTKAVDTVTWTATGKGLGPGQFEEFELSVGPFPENVDELSMPATQTYSDGTVVKWDEPTPAGEEEPEHPAPTLDLSQAAAATHGTTADTSDTVARWLGAGGLVLGLVAVGLALSTRRRRPAGAEHGQEL